jgi:hypothetical protein
MSVFVVGPALAEIYTIDLANGTAFESRYRPAVAGWDDSKVVVMTTVGNRITLDRQDITDISVETEVKGFGLVIDTTTILLGYAPNDLPTPTDGEMDSSAMLLEYLQNRQSNQPDFSVQQFVDADDAGQGGLPASGWGGFSGFGLGEPSVVTPRAPRGSPRPRGR